jgi:DNA polymerase-3 subunit delta
MRSPPATEKPVFLLHGPESYAREEALAELIAERVAPDERDLDVEYFDASAPGFSSAALLQAARTRGMFSPHRVIVVRGAEALRENRHERTREVLAQELPGLPQDSTLIFVAGAPDDGGARANPVGERLASVIRQHGDVRHFPLLRTEELARRLRQHVESLGKRISPGAASLLARRAGPELRRALLETDKLVGYCGDRRDIEEGDVLTLVPGSPEETVFTLLNHAAMGNRRQAVESLRRLLDSGEPPARILPMLSRTLRQLVQARFLREKGIRPEQTRADLGPEIQASLPGEADLYATASQGWQRERLWQQAARFTWDQLREAIDGLAMADAGTKGWETGAQDASLAMELFILRMSGRSTQ